MLLAEKLTFLEKLGLGSQTAIIGIGVVFVMLFALVGFIMLMEYLVKIAVKKEKNSNGETVADQAMLVSEQEELAVEQDSQETIAAIMAAINLVLSDGLATVSGPRAKFIVKSIKKI